MWPSCVHVPRDLGMWAWHLNGSSVHWGHLALCSLMQEPLGVWRQAVKFLITVHIQGLEDLKCLEYQWNEQAALFFWPSSYLPDVVLYQPGRVLCWCLSPGAGGEQGWTAGAGLGAVWHAVMIPILVSLFAEFQWRRISLGCLSMPCGRRSVMSVVS